MPFRPEDNEDLIGKSWRKGGFEYRLVGIMMDTEDWWWVLTRGVGFSKHTQLLSCVCRIETYGFERIKD